MTSSFRKIDYSLRPAKHAERKMLAEIFRRLVPFCSIDQYKYIGFGSIWFSDFIIFHKLLGIKDMVSIEQASTLKERFEANKPFDITVAYDKSSVILPKLDWSRHQFLWLDYDDPLSVDILADARTVAIRAIPGTVLAVSVQCMQSREFADSADERNGATPLGRFRQRFGRERVAADVSEEDLHGWPFGRLSRTMIKAEVDAGLAARNARSGTLEFKLIAQIEYNDDAKMTTIVGIFVDTDHAAKLEACDFKSLDFVLDPDIPVRIEMPKLTVRELRHIERQLPKEDLNMLDLGSIPSKEAKNFARMYRYFPNFAVIET